MVVNVSRIAVCNALASSPIKIAPIAKSSAVRCFNLFQPASLTKASSLFSTHYFAGYQSR